MRIALLFISLITFPWVLPGQKNELQLDVRLPKNYISVNPLNIILFQQAGITYEYKPGVLGYEITTGYIYPNKKEYSNYFIAGPTNYGSLGYYSGFFVVPQVNVYLTKPNYSDEGGVVYLSLKMVYKYMHIDSTSSSAWFSEGDSYYLYRKMIDKVNIYGGFIDFGYRYFLSHFFIDLNFGVGSMWVNHKMIIAGEKLGTSPYPMIYINPLRREELHKNHVSINFTLNFGFAF
jgi:hypothetical protein